MWMGVHAYPGVVLAEHISARGMRCGAGKLQVGGDADSGERAITAAGAVLNSVGVVVVSLIAW
jgi:hypothetical protein